MDVKLLKLMIEVIIEFCKMIGAIIGLLTIYNTYQIAKIKHKEAKLLYKTSRRK